MWPKYSKSEIDAVVSILKGGNVNYWTGGECREFEKEFAEYVDVDFAIAVSNGTVALDLALKSLKISEGDEIIVTSRTFIASVSSIINAGAKPVFCDVSLNSQNLDEKKIDRLISKKTKAIVCVHLAGWPCEMDTILDIANKNNLFVIEDCAQAHGAKYKGRSIGSFGDIGCWSFCQDKIISTAGEGGMVTTNNKELWSQMWSYKDHGKSFDAVYNKNHPPGFRWLHESFGTNFRMTEIQAAVGRIQLSKMEEWNQLRNLYQEKIWETAARFDSIRVPVFGCKDCSSKKKRDCCIHAAYKCYIFTVSEKLLPEWDRDRIIEEINRNDVFCTTGSCSEVYLEKAFENTDLRPGERLKNAIELAETSLMFLVDPTQTESDIDHTCEVVEKVFRNATKMQ